MSFGESMFSVGFNQKTRKEDKNVKKESNLTATKTILEDSRGL
jgi:hypothetical protein